MAIRPGKKMKDGTIFVGLSPDSGEALYVAPEDAPGDLNSKGALNYVRNLESNNHRDWRLPSLNELEVIFSNRNKYSLRNSFNKSGCYRFAGIDENTNDIAANSSFFVGHVDFKRAQTVFGDKYKNYKVRAVRNGPVPS